MVSISLCMIVKNEEDVLSRCLESVSGLVDEIIIVDTGSTDRTQETAACFTDKIFAFPWQDDFAAARNEAFSHASMDYCVGQEPYMRRSPRWERFSTRISPLPTAKPAPQTRTEI